MKQLFQDLTSGETTIVEAPSPSVSAGQLVIDTSVTLISAGTERMLVEFGKANLFEKARKQPERVREVLQKVQTDGLMTTVDAVRSKLGQPLPLGYSNVGVVREVGAGIEGFAVGDRVLSNGRHADVVRVPKNLCASIPNAVPDEEAVFTVVASIGLQGLRLANPTLGERVVVTGVGLIGLITVQLLRAQGCHVLAIDFDESKLELARSFGAETCNPGRGEDPVEAGMAFSQGHGVDAVLITASTNSSEPVSQAARMSRKRGRIVLVGVTGLDLNRADFYEKELSFQVSCSYGPGRYDPSYEQQGHDYPIGFVRWTEQRNFDAVLAMMANGQLNVRPLISHRYPFEEAVKAYETLTSEQPSLGILIEYTDNVEDRHVDVVDLDSEAYFDPAKPVVGFVGAGNYASRVLIPAFKEGGAQLHTIATSGGTSAAIHGGKMGFAHASTDTASMFADDAINTVVVVTRHDTHARFVCEALAKGKNVFVEKPIAIELDELDRIIDAYDKAKKTNSAVPHLMIGFNRRFSPLTQKVKDLLDSVTQPKSFIMTMNAGAIPPEHWTQDPAVGGGRIIGEACHYVDLMRFLAGSEIESVQARRMGNAPGVAVTEDKASITLGFSDGSFGTIHYLGNGHSRFPKERIEVFAAGRVLQLDNFRKLKGYGWPGFKKMGLWRQDKGQKSCAKAFLEAVGSGKPTPIPANEIFEVARITLQATQQLRSQ